MPDERSQLVGEFRALIEGTVAGEIDYSAAYDRLIVLIDRVESSDDQSVPSLWYEVIYELQRWFHDDDIRAKDKEYAECKTQRILDWCNSNR